MSIALSVSNKPLKATHNKRIKSMLTSASKRQW